MNKPATSAKALTAKPVLPGRGMDPLLLPEAANILPTFADPVDVMRLRGIGKATYTTPERELAFAVLLLAIEDLNRQPSLTDEKRNDHRWPAREWVRSDDWSWPYSFLPLCEQLGLDPLHLRRRLLVDLQPVPKPTRAPLHASLRQKILAAMMCGKTRHGEIRRDVRRTSEAVGVALEALMLDGMVSRVADGVYALIGPVPVLPADCLAPPKGRRIYRQRVYGLGGQMAAKDGRWETVSAEYGPVAAQEGPTGCVGGAGTSRGMSDAADGSGTRLGGTWAKSAK